MLPKKVRKSIITRTGSELIKKTNRMISDSNKKCNKTQNKKL